MYKFDYESKVWGDADVSLSPFCLTAPKLKFALSNIQKLKKNSKVLEVGCGAGGIAKAIKKYRPDLDIYAIDISKKQIQIAKKNNNGANFLLGSAYKIPFKNNFFDGVVMFDVLEHLDDPNLCVKEIKRVLKHKGLFSLFTPIEGNILSVHGFIYNLFNFNPKEKYGGHVQNFNYSDVKNILERNKLNVVNKNYYGHYFNQLVDYSYFLLLSINGKNTSGSVESMLHNNGGFKIFIIKIIKNLIALISYLESEILFFFPASGVNILSISEK